MTHSYAVRAVLKHYPNLNPTFVRQRLWYSTYLDLEKKFMYFGVPKAACTAMKELINSIEHAPDLQYLAGNAREVRRDMFIHARVNVALPSLMDVDDETQRWVLKSPDFLRMTVVRNPYTRLVAAWRNKVLLCEPGFEVYYRKIKGHTPEVGRKSLISFEEFIKYVADKCNLRNLHTCDSHWQLQVDHTFFPIMNFSFVGKVEHMAEVLTTLQRHLNLPRPLSLNQSNSSAIISPPRLGEELWEKIYLLYKDDFDTLHYEKTAIPPIQEVATRAIPEEKYINDIIERHVVIALLYNKCAYLTEKVERVERFHLLTMVDACMVPLRLLRKGLGSWRRWLVGLILSRMGLDLSGRSHQRVVE